MEKKRTITLRQLLLYDAIVLLLMGVFMFVIEMQVVEKNQKANLLEKLQSLNQTLDKSYEETEEVRLLWDFAVWSKGDALAYLHDLQGYLDVDQSLLDRFNINCVYIENEEGHLINQIDPDLPFEMKENHSYFSSMLADNRNLMIESDNAELDTILDSIFTNNKILTNAAATEDMFLVIDNEGMISYFTDTQFIGQPVSALGIELEDLLRTDVQWLRVNRKYHYIASVINDSLGVIISTGITSDHMTSNSYTAISAIFAIICVIFTIVFTYVYFCRQQQKKNEDNISYSRNMVIRKMVVFTVFGLILIAVMTFYVQTLFNLSLHSIATRNEISQIETTSAEAVSSSQQLQKLYDESYLQKAQEASYILSEHPECRTREELKKLSDIFDFEYIMMFDPDGNETVSDSGIIGFKISDDPQDQSYEFRVLMHGIPYYIQEARNEELTGTFRQYIGVLTYDREGEMDGFLQIAVSPEKLQNIIDEVSLENILDKTIGGTDEEVFAVDSESGLFTYASDPMMIDKKAVDYGFKENQLRNNYYGDIRIDGILYNATSFSLDNQYIYIVDKITDIHRGRATITALAAIVSLLNLLAFAAIMKNRDVVTAEDQRDDLYVDVEVAGGDRKKSVNILSRFMRERIDWADKTPEDKTGLIARVIFGISTVLILIAIAFKGIVYTDNSIFGFIISNRWEKGFNVFALTKSLIFFFSVYLAMNVVKGLLNSLIRMVSPRNETVIRLLKSLIRYAGVITVIYYCLTQFGFDSRSLLASAGLLTLVVGLGAQDLITDILAGIFIIFENEFQVGDIIEVKGYKGRVIEIGIRTTRIVNTIQDVKSVNNRNLTNVVNKTRKNSYCDVIINLPFDQDIKAIEKVLIEELPKIREKCPYILEGPNYGGIDDMSGRVIRISIRAECLEAYKFEVRTIINREIKRLFDENGFRLI